MKALSFALAHHRLLHQQDYIVKDILRDSQKLKVNIINIIIDIIYIMRLILLIGKVQKKLASFFIEHYFS